MRHVCPKQKAISPVDVGGMGIWCGRPLRTAVACQMLERESNDTIAYILTRTLLEPGIATMIEAYVACVVARTRTAVRSAAAIQQRLLHRLRLAFMKDVVVSRSYIAAYCRWHLNIGVRSSKTDQTLDWSIGGLDGTGSEGCLWGFAA